MKKFICALLAMLMLLTLCACGGSDDTQTPADDTVLTPDTTEPGYVFVDNGVEIAINAPAADIIAALGEPIDTTEENSCAFEGKDVTYFYANYEILVACPDGKDGYISSVYLKSDAVSTAEGLEIGMAQDKVVELYGENTFDDPLYIYTKGDMQLRIKCVDGFVESIEYTLADVQ